MSLSEPNSRRFAILLSLSAAVLSLLPSLFGWLNAPPGARFVGAAYNLDDHMVYAAWMRQAAEGRILFENRFTTDPQPGLTLNVYFLALGWISALLGIPATMALSRAVFTGLFFWLAFRLVSRVTTDVFARKLALSLVAIGGGVGFLVWQSFGTSIQRPVPEFLSNLLLGRLPIDVWQPEAFVFPSLLTNGLFMASLCAILWLFEAVLDAEDSWKPVWRGALAFALLMNFHSYDVLLVTLVLVALLACQLLRRRISWAWIGRVAAMGAGAVPPALWFWHVLRSDPVFQARAATETFSPNFRQMAAGLILLVSLTAVSVFAPTATYRDPRRRAAMALGLAAGLLLWLAAAGHREGYWISSIGTWLVMFALAVAIAAGLSTPNPAKNLFLAWASVSFVAVYFPALFQRKLAMGIQIPWAVIGALGLALVIQRVERNMRNLATAVGMVLVGATSGLWLQRELLYLRWNVSNTTVHAPYLSNDAARIVDALAREPGRKVVLAMPGIPAPLEAPDRFGTPIVPDLNPVLTGLAGCVTFAGHWSETPRYVERRRRLTALFLATSPASVVEELLAETEADYIVAPVPEAFRVLPLPLRDLSSLGEVVVNGSQFRLIRLPERSPREG
ncbi:MAG: hypothetical protein N2109_11185 [Fimbriimonadales bacterium]|nr:hypothetical protein [Fimbriimonadales bacterium]